MRVTWAILGLGIFGAVLPASASVVLGFVGTESGIPIAGQEDIVIYNLTGPVFGCSTAAGSPICTSVTFDNVVLTVNGTVNLNLGSLAPGATETYTIPGGTFVDGTINSITLSTTLSATALVDDLSNTFNVDSAVSLSGIPTDGSLTAINGTSSGLATPEPTTTFLSALVCILLGASPFVLRPRS